MIDGKEDASVLKEIMTRLEGIEESLKEPSRSQLPGHEDIPDDGSFEKRMNVFVLLMLLVSALLTYLALIHHPPLFPVFFGLFFIFLILAVGLAIDEYLLPARTFRRISTNAIAISLFWISIIYLAVSGVEIGTSIISDPFGGEEGKNYAYEQERQVESKTDSGKREEAGKGESPKDPSSSLPGTEE